MVKKIINWTANGFFRSLGRFLFFFCITAILALLFANSSLKITDLLGIDTVYAATQESYSWTFYNVKTCAPNTPTYSCIQTSNRQPNTGYLPVTENSDFQGYLNEWNVLFSNTSSSWTANKTYSVKVGLGVSSSNVSNTTHSLYWWLTSQKSPKFYMYGSTDTNMANVSSSNIANFSCSILENENAVNRIYFTCTFQPTTALKMFQMKIYYGDNTKITFDKYGYMTMDNFSSTEDLSGFITNQTEVIQNNFNTTNQLIESLTDSLSDDDVDDDSDDMIDFINDFELEGSSDIDTLITLPIDFIERVFTENTTADFCTNFRGKAICLPNGKLLWNRTYNCNESIMVCDRNTASVSAFKELFSILVAGYLSYKIMRSIAITYNDLLDPYKDKIEVVKL